MSNPIDHRIQRFRELHANKWFHVMNWNLDFMRTTDKAHRRTHGAAGLGFYLAASPVEPRRIIISGPGISRIEKIDK
jgi:hypothetical protein